MIIKPLEGVKLQDTAINLLTYIDDIKLMEEWQTRLKLSFNICNDAAQKAELQINKQKMEYMIIGRQEQLEYLSIKVNQFEFKKEVAAKIQVGNKSYCKLIKLLSLKLLKKKNQKWLYAIMLQAVILYRSETWTLRKSYKNKLLILKRKILQDIFRSIKDNITGDWR